MPLGDRVLRVAGDRVGEGRLAGAVRAHDRVGLAGADGEVDAAQDLPRACRRSRRRRAGRGSRGWPWGPWGSLSGQRAALTAMSTSTTASAPSPSTRDAVDGDRAGGRGAGGLAGAQVEARAVQPALDRAAVDLALGQRDVGVRADVADRVQVAAVGVADDGDGHARRRRRASAPELGTSTSLQTSTALTASSSSRSSPAAGARARRRCAYCRSCSHSGRPRREITSAKKPRTTSRVATSAGMPRDCR